MRRLALLPVLAAALSLGSPLQMKAQDVPQNFLTVGEMAPDFELPGATRYGVLQRPVRLSEYRGKTVVVAFFYRVRGGG